MNQTFFVRKYHRNVGLMGVGFFSLMILLSISVAWTNVPQGRGTTLAFIFSIFWALLLCAAIYSLVAYARSYIRISDATVCAQGAILSRSILLSDVLNLYWRRAYGGVIRLDSSRGRVRIRLDSFERAESLKLIEFFRQRIPEETQHGWQMFCHKIALPLCDPPMGKSVQECLDEPGAVLISRHRWDRLFLPVIAATGIGGIVLAWQLQQADLLAAWSAPTVLWLVLRLFTPKDGMVSQSISCTPGLSRYLLFMFAWVFIGVAGIFAFRLLKAMIPNPMIVGATLMVLWYAGVFWRAYLEDRRRHLRDLENSVRSADEWTIRHGSNVMRPRSEHHAL